MFFFALSISAYVSPSYSKIGSQPAPVSLSQSETDVRTRADIPKWVGPRAGTILPFARFSGDSSQIEGAAHIDSSLKNDRLLARSRAVGEGADGLGALVVVRHEEIVQAFMAKRLKEPFAMIEGLIKPVSDHVASEARYVHVRTGQVFQCIEAETCIFCQNRPSYLPIFSML